MPVTSASQISKTDNFVATVVDDELVLLNILDGRFYSLEGVGRRAWDLLDEHARVADLVSAMRQQYDVSEEQCSREIVELLDELEKNQFVSIS